MKNFSIKFLLVLFISTFFFSCKPNLMKGKDLASEDILYIQKMGLLDKNEEIVIFATQGGLLGLKSSGNFYTKKRVASYWIDKNHPEKTSKDFAFYEDIDTIICQPRLNAVTLSSSLEIKNKSGKKFNVFVDADSAQTWKFFNGVIKMWQKSRI